MKLIHSAVIAASLVAVAASDAQAQTRKHVAPHAAISQEARDAYAAQAYARAHQQTQQQSHNPLLDQFHGN